MDHTKDQEKLPRIVFVLGGTRSGKSAYAETVLERLGKQKVYIATAQAFDDEMTSRIVLHRERRKFGQWRDVEAPYDLAASLGQVAASEAVLIDCVTLWLSNHLLAEHDLDAVIEELAAALDRHPGDVVIVSNEVGQGIVPENKLARQFRDAQGRLNQRLAALADCAVLVAAGLPLCLKGTPP